MNHLMSRRNLKNTAAVLAGLLFLILIILLPRAGTYILAEDELAESDIIVILMGSIPDRVLQGADIFLEGFGEEIVMVRENMRSYDDLLGRGVEVPGRADLSKMAAVELGVP